MTLYMDHAATSPLRSEAREAFLRVSGQAANASSIHTLGRKAKVALEDARTSILRHMNAEGAAGLVFTSGGTEANALALLQARGFDRVIVSAGEHDSIYSAAQRMGLPVEIAPLTPAGQVDVDALKAMLNGPAFVAAMLVNNETGVISDIAAVAGAVHALGGWLHVDAVQALGKIDVDFRVLGADTLSLSAHKVGGGQGVGALIYDRDRTIAPLIFGGGQELGMRGGTENIPGIAAFAAAVEACNAPATALNAAQAEVEASLKGLGVTILGEDAPRAPGILCLAQSLWPSAQQLIYTDMAGICVSSGSACSSGKVKESRVAQAMDLSDMADKVLRVSTGWNNSPEDWYRFYEVWSKGFGAFQKRRNSMKEVA